MSIMTDTIAAPEKKLTISLLIPCYNEETAIENTILSSLKQTRPFDQLVYVNDCSKDRTLEILNRYADRITVKSTPKNTGNKSSAQEYGLQFVTGDVLVTTDGDTLLDEHFAEEVEKSFSEPRVAAVAGYVRSLPYNWLTACRAYEYTIGQRLHKIAQHYMDYIFVMPGAASAFRTDMFRKYCTFDHDTITEDLDFTYKMHQRQLKIVHNPRAVTYTQDPATLHGYINQMRRWCGGGWQNLMKHYRETPTRPIRALEMSLIYFEGTVFASLLFIVPLLNLRVWFIMMLGYLAMAGLFSVWAAIMERRPGLLLVPFYYLPIVYINAYIFIEQFVKEVLLGKKNLIWFQPERVTITSHPA
jgi:poly-beta-1,6-N-acetyl-D-glucosamine synthase